MRGFVRGLIIAISAVISIAAVAEPASDYRTAERAFYAIPNEKRFELGILLIATGHFNAMSSTEFGPRLFKSLRQFQASIGASQTGYLSDDQSAKLRSLGYTTMGSWGMAEVMHPYTNAKLWVPKRLSPRQDYTKRGYAFEAPDRSFAVDFSFFPTSESSLEDLYAKLGSSSGARRVDYKVIRPGFFAIAGGMAERGFYIRYQPSRGGVVGFTASWDTTRIDRGERVANLMSNLFLVIWGAETAPSPGASEVALTPPQPEPMPPKKDGSTGTGFFVAPKRMLTNAHVVEGCTSVVVKTAKGATGVGRVLARDTTNDLALIDASVEGEAIAKLRAGIRLGEDVAAFGYPLNGLLATNGNFTRGNVTATAGLKDDTSRIQISAPVQPGNSGGPLLDESGNVTGVVVSKLQALNVAIATGDIPQNVNFAIKASVAQTFLETNGVAFETGAVGETIKAADLAERAQSFSGVIACQP